MASSHVSITVAQEGWGEGRPRDIKALLENVAAQQLSLFPEIRPEISVMPTSECPLVSYRFKDEGPYTVHLSARDCYWAQYAYQFAHELCHILQGYERLTLRRHQWFHETLCEVASLLTLRRMGISWAHAAPFLNWTDYAPSLIAYAEDRISCTESQLAHGESLSSWLAQHETQLSEDPELRELNNVAALKILPLVEADPDQWRSIAYLPNSDGSFSDYLAEWEIKTPPEFSLLPRSIRVTFGF